MTQPFNEEEFKKTLIDRGIDPAAAAEVAAKTAKARAGQTAPVLVSTAESLRNALRAAPRASEPTEAAKPAKKQPGTSMTTKKRATKSSAVEDVSAKVSEAKQRALIQRTSDEVKAAQLSLFDLAPWDDDMRAMPNDYGRSALFTVRNKRQKRLAYEQKAIYHYNNDVLITFTGVELRADDDELVWQQVLEYAKRFPVGEPVYFSMYQLLTDLDWPINGHYYDKAEASLTRLQANAMQITSPRFGVLDSVSLIDKFKIVNRGTKKAMCRVEIDQKIIYLFAGDHYSKFVWSKYRKLKPITRRLFDYLASHKEPYPLKLETFRLICGSESERAAKWKEQTKEACKELSDSGLVASTWVNGDSIYCEREANEKAIEQA
ncbi:TrfA protein [Burkholderia sp. SRS-W-2-2016]|uniref:plasmid replication initiator TrfA n=1 Tax=Burkholderia sp. SRS-W-2-2016 TaxID=1926878 RepID=UPI00094B0DA5|nr:plasmid replication initiator TrfA [Burkholderia sp. SRS-W-2-2016]OLL27284.1 TrfA protein [Burkholderia sp. SRS-W-2-2016]